MTDFDFERAEQLVSEITERLDELLKMDVVVTSRKDHIEELSFRHVWHGEPAFDVDWMAFANDDDNDD